MPAVQERFLERTEEGIAEKADLMRRKGKKLAFASRHQFSIVLQYISLGFSEHWCLYGSNTGDSQNEVLVSYRP